MTLGLRPFILAAGGACALFGALFVIVAALMLGGWGSGALSSTTAPLPASAMVADIPPEYLQLYMGAAQRYGVDWAILAAIGKVECDHGQDPDPSCTVVGVQNSAGAGGPMQFETQTWKAYGVDPAGNPASPADRWNPVDAIYSAANYLRASGAPGDYYDAIFAYNHASWYVAEVEAWAATYAAALSTPDPLSGQTATGDTAQINGQGDAVPPFDAPAVVQQMVLAANNIVGFPYVYGGGYADPAMSLSVTDPQPSGGGYDCASSVSYVLHAGGLLSGAEDSSALEGFGDPGPGRWVTVYANAGHAFVAIAGVVLNTVWLTPRIEPASPASGPRWQPTSTIAAQIAVDQYGGFVVRHPPGL